MKLKSILLIAAGVLIAGYPIMRDIYTQNAEKALLNDWDKMTQNQKINDIPVSDEDDVSSEAAESFMVLDDTFSTDNGQENGNDTLEQVDQKQSGNTDQPDITILGVLEIDKINVKLPILDGSTPTILKKGAGKLKGTSDIGKIGNTAISAHRSHKYGLNFNRLDEVALDDLITVTTLESVYSYKVFNIQVVEPDDVSVLKKSKTESILTLITCHPLYTATHRLIVQARLLPNE